MFEMVLNRGAHASIDLNKILIYLNILLPNQWAVPESMGCDCVPDKFIMCLLNFTMKNSNTGLHLRYRLDKLVSI